MQNYNPKIKKVQQLVILSKTKNLGCDAVSSVLWPDSSAAPQDDRKIGPFGRNQRKNALFTLCLCAFVPQCLIFRQPVVYIRVHLWLILKNKANF